MTFRPTRYPCGGTAPHAQHQHNDGPDNYTYLCAGREEPTLTASEVKVLTETASKVAYALGRKDAGEEIAETLQAYVENYPEDIFPPDGTTSDSIAAKAMRHAYPNAARIALEVSSQAAGATSDATSGVPGHQEVSEAVRSPQEPGEGS